MIAMQILQKGHGSALDVDTITPSCIGRLENRHPERRPKLLKSGMRFNEAKMSKLFFVNIPYNCSDRELQEWVESRGIETRSIRIVRDLVAGVSPAFGYVELKDDTKMQEAVAI